VYLGGLVGYVKEIVRSVLYASIKSRRLVKVRDLMAQEVMNLFVELMRRVLESDQAAVLGVTRPRKRWQIVRLRSWMKCLFWNKGCLSP
jgi:hypothetical protein